MFKPYIEGKRSDILIVSFAGGALQFGGHTQLEFINTLSSLDADQLFLMDPSQSTIKINSYF